MLREAGTADVERLIAWMRELWLTESAPFNETLSRQALVAMLADRNLGRVWIVSEAGYLILTFGFSLEFGGRDAFIDEFFLTAEQRGHGNGAIAIEEASREAAKLGVNAIHLEVADNNSRAEAFYRRQGFRLHSRRLMTRWLSR